MNDLYISDNEAFLEAMGYDPADPGEDIILPPWNPTAEQLASFKKRDLEHSARNIATLERSAPSRGTRMVTNGTEPAEWRHRHRINNYRGYVAIGVQVGGPEADECLHSLGTFAATTHVAPVLCLSGAGRLRLRAA